MSIYITLIALVTLIMLIINIWKKRTAGIIIWSVILAGIFLFLAALIYAIEYTM